MRNHKLLLKIFFGAFLFATATTIYATSSNPLNLSARNTVNDQQSDSISEANNHSWYFSWGYNKDYWSDSDIHISQPALNNNFTVHNVAASDDPEWTTGIFNKNLMSPQYNIRIGHFLNRAHTWAIEVNFDHTKYNTNLYQTAHITGVINGAPVDRNQVLTPTYFNYLLHNGFNNLMINIVRRKPFYMIPRTGIKIVGVAKFGMGILLPHPINTILGNTVDVGPKKWGNYLGWRNGWWQVGGFTTGVEVGAQVVFSKWIYLELTDKEAFNRLTDIQVYQGRADQTVWLNEVILNLGTTF